MSRTLFKYIFLDLLRIFFMTSGALAGIMSFGGLLRPLTEHGLDAGQVGRMLTYFMPAMSTYSLPVAALFATTVVYGRLAADNELTACRAGGLSFWFIGSPALVLGLCVALLSLVLLCFVVPVFSLKVEQVIYSNVAKLVANEIERNHQLRFGAETIFAQEAIPTPTWQVKRGQQQVILVGPMIVAYEPANDPVDPRLRTPREFYSARLAQVDIKPAPGAALEEVEVDITLVDGTKFPRHFEGNIQGGIQATSFGPIALPPLISENVKFMDVGQLRAMAIDPAKSQRVGAAISDLVRRDQERDYLEDLLKALTGPEGQCEMATGGENDERFVLQRGDADAKIIGEELILTSAVAPAAPTSAATNKSANAPRQITLRRIDNQVLSLLSTAREVHVHATPRVTDNTLQLTIDLYDAITQSGDEATPRSRFSQSASVPMPPDVEAVTQRSLAYYVRDPALNEVQRNHLRREQIVVSNAVRDELHSRASFAVSCLILVVVGCGLGMMFRSGNFLSAFAVSFIPALLCITLIVAGQRTADHVPIDVLNHFQNPLNLGIGLIWSGNMVVLAIAIALIARLRRM